jgi:hypothetical protein
LYLVLGAMPILLLGQALIGAQPALLGTTQRLLRGGWRRQHLAEIRPNERVEPGTGEADCRAALGAAAHDQGTQAGAAITAVMPVVLHVARAPAAPAADQAPQPVLPSRVA